MKLTGRVVNRTENEAGQHSQGRMSLEVDGDQEPARKVELILSTTDVSVLAELKPGTLVTVELSTAF